MIPKKIHYCWFGRKEKPEDVLRFINTWKKMNPDFVIKEWNEDNFDVEMMPFTTDAYKMKKYAFVADVARLFALVTEGGIYLDTDVELVKPFNKDMLNKKSFVGFEQSRRLMIGTAVIGSIQEHAFWKSFFDMYKSMRFINEEGHLNIIPNVDYLTEKFLKSGANFDNCEQEVNKVFIYPREYFSPKNYATKQIKINNNTVAIHHFAGTWQPRWKKILLRIWTPLTVKFPSFTDWLKYFIKSSNYDKDKKRP